MATKRAPKVKRVVPSAAEFAAIAAKYELDVVEGRILACKETIQACQRNIDDHARTDGLYYYSPEAGAKPCRFLSKLKHIEGALAGQFFDMHPAHVWFVMTGYAWLKRENGLRRFSRLHYEVARGNAKSFLSSGLALYHLCADGDDGAQVYSAATTLKQAKTVFRVSKAMAQKSSDLREHYGVNVWAHSLTIPRTASKLEAICSKAETQDGLNISFAVIDEIHAHKTRDLYDVVITAMGKRAQSMCLVITTAGTNRNGIAYELRSYLQQVLAGELEDDALLGIIYTLDATDDWKDPAVLVKANPLWNFSVIPAKILELQRVAIATPAAQSNFRTKHCNVYTNAGVAYFNTEKLTAAVDKTLDISDFYGKRCWIGVDLASKCDLASVVLTFKDGKKRYQFERNYLNQQAIDDGNNKNYELWAEQGHLLVNPGAVTDHTRIESDIENDLKLFDVADIGIDPHNAGLMSQRLSSYTSVTEVRQSVAGLSEPTKAMDAAIRDGNLITCGNPVTTWCYSNVMAYENKAGAVFPFKARPDAKIDTAIAGIISLSRANAEDDGDEDNFNDLIGLKPAAKT